MRALGLVGPIALIAVIGWLRRLNHFVEMLAFVLFRREHNERINAVDFRAWQQRKQGKG